MQEVQSQPPMILSSDQQECYDKILAWLEGKFNKGQELSLGGYAGTGKTTLLKKLTDELMDSHNPLTMSLTGKAVSVLIRKGVDAATIHSSIYFVHMEKKKPIFTLRPTIEEDPDLLIIDEASMVSVDLYRDLLSFGHPILWVGDHGQLEPIGRNPGVMKDPILKLEKIHRQAEGNPIIALADKIRRGSHPSAIVRKDDNEIEILSKKSIPDSKLLEPDQIIVGINRTRVKINKLVRELKGYPLFTLQPGDKVVCLKNDRKQGLFNGLQGVIVTVAPDKSWPIYHCMVKLDGGRVWKGEMHIEQFNKAKGLHESERAFWGVTHWDYAYAVTCHKAQGSEWPTVMVVEESAGTLWAMPRWRYTAVTRASERLLYAC